MKSDWAATTLGEVVNFRSGGTPSKANPAFWGGDFPWVSAKDMKSLRLHDTEDHLTTEGAMNGTRIAGSETPLLLTRGMTLLSDVPISIPQQPMAFNQDVKAIEPKNVLSRRFLVYLLLSLKPTLLNMVDLAGHGTGRLNTDQLKSLVVYIPSLPEQRAIAHILSTLDDKIELNRQMNQTLEQIAAALFKSWFVDFDPVRAKAAGRQPEGMDAETAALFPDRFVDSDMGEVPEGWQVGKLEDLAQSTRESVNPSKSPDELFSHYSLPAYDSGRMPIVESGESIKSNKFLLPDAAVLISKLNPHIPRIWLPFDSNGHRRIASTEFVVVQSLDRRHRPFLYALASSPEFVQRMQGMVTGTTGSHQRVPPTALMSMSLVMPPTSLVDAYSDLMRPVYERVHANLGESRTLAQLRETLLPRLLSGELRVPTDVLDEEAVTMPTPPEPALVQSRF